MCMIFRPWEYELIWDGGTWGALVSVIVIGTAIAFGLYLQGVSMIGPLKGSILASVEPLSAVIISFFLAGNSFCNAGFPGIWNDLRSSFAFDGGAGEKIKTAETFENKGFR